MKPAACISLAILLSAGPVAAATCTASSGAQRVTLLELYTSEGCDSCPPADRWISALPARGLGADRVVTLAYHVDYWNYLGWKDPFAQARFTERQRFVNARIRNRTIYTPQLMLDGQDYRQGLSLKDIQDRVATVNREKPGADIALSLNTSAGALETDRARHAATARTPAPGCFWRSTKTNWANQVSAGENKGKRLEHDFVVRELAGPFAAGAATITHKFGIAPSWKTRDLSVAAFVADISDRRSITGAVCYRGAVSPKVRV